MDQCFYEWVPVLFCIVQEPEDAHIRCVGDMTHIPGGFTLFCRLTVGGSNLPRNVTMCQKKRRKEEDCKLTLADVNNPSFKIVQIISNIFWRKKYTELDFKNAHANCDVSLACPSISEINT